MMHMPHFEEPVAKVKAGTMRQVRKVIAFGHTEAVRLSREYCHLVYFGGVFVEGHGVYSYAAGTLFILSIIGLAAGEEIE